MKTCNTCDNQQKYLTKGLCRKCYYILNKEHILAYKAENKSPNKAEYNRNYYLVNKSSLLKKKKQYHEEHRDEKLIYKKQYYVKNRQKIIDLNLLYIKRRSKIDPLYKISRNIRSRLNSALKNNHKTGSAIRDLGCSIDFFKTHLENQFVQGMTWDNYGPKGWHIDHIRPLCSYDLSNPEELKIACHYTNLRPLWWSENLSKGGYFGKP